MEVKPILTNKKQFLDLLLLADEQEDMIDRYLERGDMFALYDGDLKSICVVTQEGDAVYELKSIATAEKYQGRGYGTFLVKYILDYYRDRCKTMFIGTGEITAILRFYENCGFKISHRVKNIFLDNYDHPIFEDGVQLRDMVYLSIDV
ncbi:MAG: GNAT family N-acetyltransferase [Methanofollis sp.]|uniref:GNAT family N-acetyltransferase n=1 Tax=Methanofollis sp. TaxID=2052835 RepID=UPI002607D9EB|nr:GNAT family N-acetyltransferase [Methanofollis sp.]MDD4255457.1 GNAT family N-acetyltransferase [Methanofollis sp.]